MRPFYTRVKTTSRAIFKSIWDLRYGFLPFVILQRSNKWNNVQCHRCNIVPLSRHSEPNAINVMIANDLDNTLDILAQQEKKLSIDQEIWIHIWNFYNHRASSWGIGIDCVNALRELRWLWSDEKKRDESGEMEPCEVALTIINVWVLRLITSFQILEQTTRSHLRLGLEYNNDGNNRSTIRTERRQTTGYYRAATVKDHNRGRAANWERKALVRLQRMRLEANVSSLDVISLGSCVVSILSSILDRQCLKLISTIWIYHYRKLARILDWSLIRGEKEKVVVIGSKELDTFQWINRVGHSFF